MTIQEGPQKSSDPLSSKTTKWTTEDSMNNLPDVEAAPMVVQVEAVTATLVASNDSALTSCLTKVQDDDWPLLKKVTIDKLPPRFQTLLQDELNPEMNVEFIPTHIPKWYCGYYVFIMIASIAITVLASVQRQNGFLDGSFLEMVCLVFGIFILYKYLQLRAPLYAKDRNGVRKAWPGDWKIGVYLVGTSAVLDFDGTHAWLFPLDSIIEFDHRQSGNKFTFQGKRSICARYPTIMKVRMHQRQNEETLNHVFFGFEEACEGEGIEDWYRRCTD